MCCAGGEKKKKRERDRDREDKKREGKAVEIEIVFERGCLWLVMVERVKDFAELKV
jgi:hypothetical protein